jgi:hypothetical protein
MSGLQQALEYIRRNRPIEKVAHVATAGDGAINSSPLFGGKRCGVRVGRSDLIG